MKLGITGSTDIKQFNPILYLQLKEPNFRRFCIENGFEECSVSEVVTGSSAGIDDSVKIWAELLRYNFRKCSSLEEIISGSDILLLVQSATPLPSDILLLAQQQQKPVYQISEYSR